MNYVRVAATLVATSSLVPLTLAQAERESDTDTVRLSPFTVQSQRDFGYQASNSITATGIGTPIRDIPANINVLTRDFIRDRGVDDLRFVADSASSSTTNIRERRQINLRGFEALIQQNGFDNNYLSFENVDRVEIIKGPSAVFHGVVRPGGVVNVIKATPKFDPSSSVVGRIGSYDYYKGAVATTGPLVRDVLAYNLYLSHRDQGGRADYTNETETFGSAGLTWRANERLTLTADYEAHDLAWTSVHSIPVSHPAYVRAVNEGTVPPLQAPRTWLDQNIGPNEPLAQIFIPQLVWPGDFRDFNANGPDGENRRDGYSLRGIATFQATDYLDLNLQAAKARYDEEIIDFNTFRPVAGSLPGQFIFNNRYEQRESGSETTSIKLEAALKLHFLAADHQLLVGALAQSNRAYTRTLIGPTRIWDPRADPIRRGREEIRSAYPNGFPTRPAPGKATTQALYASNQAAFLEGKLRLVLGARWTETKNASGQKQRETTPQFGALYRLTETLSLYGNYSETFEPNYLLDGNGRQLDPISGKGSEAGVKIETSDSRFTTTLAFFETERANIPRRDFPNEQLTGVVPLYILGGVERNRGFEADFTWSPAPNYQIVAAYSYSWEHKTIASTGDIRQVGVDLPNVPDHVLNVWNKYTFVRGPLANVSIGGGAKFVTDQKLHPSWDVPVRGDGYVTFDAMIGYERKIDDRKTLEVQLNLFNLTSERYYQGTYLTSDPLSGQLTVRLQF